ncbi:MAG: class I SAM-dependent methyltransferase [Bacteroidetes bacterium]|nr:class I SAM-dependent methyltransferase [Bacteroidota bacterium]
MQKIKSYILQQLFHPGLTAFLINPFFLGKSAMYINIKKFSGFVSGKTLDVGCGSKPYVHLFSKVTSYTGMDIEQSGHTHQNEHIEVFYDGEHFPFEENSFDSLVFFEVLEHVFNPDKFFMQIKKVVKPGGHCLITIPFIWGEHEQPYDFARYSSFGLKHLFDAHGFEIVRHKKYLTDFRLIFLLINSYLYTTIKKYIPGLTAWIFIIPFSILNNLLGLLSYFFPRNIDLYFGNIYVLKNKKK